MPCRVARNLISVLIPCVMLCGISTTPSVASPAGSRTSGIVPEARQQIRIMASVPPTMTVRQQIATKEESSAFCVWSNSPISQYDVKIEVQRDFENSRPHLVVQSGSSECPIKGSITKSLNKVDILAVDTQSTNVVTLMISPH